MCVRIHANTGSGGVKRIFADGDIRLRTVVGLVVGVPPPVERFAKVQHGEPPAGTVFVGLGDVPPQAPADDGHEQPGDVPVSGGERVLAGAEEGESHRLAWWKPSAGDGVAVQGFESRGVPEVVGLNAEHARADCTNTSAVVFLVSRSP